MSALTFLFRWRVAVLSVLAACAVVFAAVTLSNFQLPVGAWFLASISIVAGSAVAYVHLRHLGMALLSVLAPVPGMMAAASFVAVPSNTAVLAVFGLASAGAALLAGDIVRRVVDGQGQVDAAREALARFVRTAAISGLAGSGLLAGWLSREAQVLALEIVALMLAALFSATTIVPFAASVMMFDENFFTAANRAREAREKVLRWAAEVTVPRRGLSIAGVTVVFAVLGWFGAAPLLGRSTLLMQPVPWLASALGLSIAVFWVGRCMRDTAAALLAFATISLAGFWLWGWAVGHLTVPAFVAVVMVELAALQIVLVLVGRQHELRRAGDEAAVARLKAIEEFGATPWFACAGAAASVFPWIIVHGAMATLAILFLGAAAAALLAVPAATTAIESLLPHRQSVSERYGRRRG